MTEFPCDGRCPLTFSKTAVPKRDRILLLIFAVLTAAFFLYYLLCLFGRFDFTAKSGLVRVHADVSDGEEALMFDRDGLTFWNTYDRDIAEDSAIELFFAAPTQVQSITMEGTIPPHPAFAFLTADGDWQTVSAETADGETFTFSEPAEAESLRIEAGEGAPESGWRICELYVNGR